MCVLPSDLSRHSRSSKFVAICACRFQARPAWLVGFAAALLVAFALTTANAQIYPSRLIRIIVPFPAGGLNDAVARLLQPHLEKGLGQTVIVDNRPGASGIVGTDAVAKSAPDGHTLIMVASTHTVTPAVNSRLPYNTEQDLAPIVIVGKNPLLFVVNARVAAKTVGEFVALAKSSPGKLNYATPGAASQSHLVTELWSARAGIKMQHVPYRGGAPAITATIAGDAEFTVISPLLSLPHIESGAVRPIASGSLRRDAQLPHVPTLTESGFPGLEAIQWVGLLAPAATPKHIVERLNGEVNRALRDPDLTAKLAAQGITPAGGTPDEFQRVISSEIRQWTEVARAANIKAD
jgi:tripartite-type tricarboxylate transporter receptor subunit TctC